MRIAAVCDENFHIYPDFGRCPVIRLYDAEDDEIISSEDIPVTESGNDAVSKLLIDLGATVLLCGNLGPDAMIALALADVEINGGVEGEADKAVHAYLNGTLENNDVSFGEETSSSCHGCSSCSGCGGSCAHCHDSSC